MFAAFKSHAANTKMNRRGGGTHFVRERWDIILLFLALYNSKKKVLNYVSVLVVVSYISISTRR